MLTIARRARLIISAVTLLLCGVAVFTPGLILAQGDTEQPCEFAGPYPFRCKVQKHYYGTSCEGIDCYYDLETCCG